MSDYEKRGYLLEDFRLFHLRTVQDAKVDYHYHDFYKLLLLISGNGSYTVEDRRYLLQPGDAVLIGRQCVHRPELESGSAYERIIVYISPDFLQRESANDCDLTALFSGAGGHVLRMNTQASRRIFALASMLERELSSNAFGRSVLSNAALLRLLVEVGRCRQQGETQTIPPIQPRNNRILDLKRYIDTHLEEDLDIDLLAERFYISKYHMMRLFRREVGVTIHTYLSHQRLLHARNLIQKGMRATEACYRSGFRSYSSFTRAYGAYFGTTPTGRTEQNTPDGEPLE